MAHKADAYPPHHHHDHQQHQHQQQHYPVVMQQPMLQTVQVQKTNWSSGMCDCCNDMGICCCGLFFPVCLACKVSSDFGECCCTPVLAGGDLAIRTGIRERYRIQGSICDDCVCLYFCYQCTICQMAREIKHRQVQVANVQVVMQQPIVGYMG
ncbi:cornifelin homolog [Lethenteron reissneri]|uniref:cornifelin homolog n=1 Tax=Lethenteron reissneri TaxID=7753 RepID=UPI002AB79683|nr:cornifelin homolog [Lethenteron reissneri]XP_061432888.1 cornifelin homolog [Lethenteron reissneri]